MLLSQHIICISLVFILTHKENKSKRGGKMRIVVNNIDVSDYNKLDQKLKETSLSKTLITKQMFKKFIEKTDEAIDFLFK